MILYTYVSLPLPSPLLHLVIAKTLKLCIGPFSNYSQWNQVNSIQKSDALVYDGFTGAFASFSQTGDPNAHKLTNGSEPGVPESWKTGEEYVIEADGFENVKSQDRTAECAVRLLEGGGGKCTYIGIPYGACACWEIEFITEMAASVMFMYLPRTMSQYM